MILTILQARVSSTRLPNKVLKPILGRPMLARQIERVKRAKLLDIMLVATSTDPTDDPLEELCFQLGVPCFRGSLDDVLDRFYQAAKLYGPAHIVRLTGDCPLADPEVIDQVISYHLQFGFDYTSNTVEPTYPDGMDVEIFKWHCLEDAWREAELPSQREHVTPFIYMQPYRYAIGSFKSEIDLSFLRWTVDAPEDFVLVTRIYESLYLKKPAFTMQDILQLLTENPELQCINDHLRRNEGYLKSLKEDESFIKVDKNSKAGDNSCQSDTNSQN